MKKTVYIAFDYDDLDVKGSLIAQSKRPDCPWDFVDNSINTAVSDKWPAEARRLIQASKCVIVLCGEQTYQADGVATEIQIAQELGKPYFLLAGTRKATPTKPKHARDDDRIWTYTWATVRMLLTGGTPPENAIVL